MAINVNEKPGTPLNALSGCYLWRHGKSLNRRKGSWGNQDAERKENTMERFKEFFLSRPVTGQCWEDSGFIFFPVLHHRLLHTDKIPPEHSLPRLNPPSFLSLLLCIRCSKALITLVALCWTHSSTCPFLLYWGTQCSKCVSFTIFSTSMDLPKSKNNFYFSKYPGSKATEILLCISKPPHLDPL